MNVSIFGFRRIPGTLALAVTNFVAAMVWSDSEAWLASPATEVPRSLAPVWVWSIGWMISSIGLFAVIVMRVMNRPIRLPLRPSKHINVLLTFHVFALLSLFIWIMNSVGVLYDRFVGELTISPVALALYAWANLGQLAMIFGPLSCPRRVAYELTVLPTLDAGEAGDSDGDA